MFMKKNRQHQIGIIHYLVFLEINIGIIILADITELVNVFQEFIYSCDKNERYVKVVFDLKNGHYSLVF